MWIFCSHYPLHLPKKKQICHFVGSRGGSSCTHLSDEATKNSPFIIHSLVIRLPHNCTKQLWPSPPILTKTSLALRLTTLPLLSCTYFTNPGHRCHSALAVGRGPFMAPLGKEEVQLIVISGAAVLALSHQRRAHKFCLCMGKISWIWFFSRFVFVNSTQVIKCSLLAWTQWELKPPTYPYRSFFYHSPSSQRVGASSVLSVGDGELRRISGKLRNSYWEAV